MPAAKKLTILDRSGIILGLNFNVRFEKMDRAKKIEIDHCVEFMANNKVEYAALVKNVPVFDQQPSTIQVPHETYVDTNAIPDVLTAVDSSGITDKADATEVTSKKAWLDPAGNMYSNDQVTHYFKGQWTTEKTKTTIFEIVEFQPMAHYNNNHIIDKYYEPWPDEDGFKKETDKNAARRKNLIAMRSLWEYLDSTNTVAKGDFNVSSGGFLSADGYIRAVSFENHWGLEIGVRKEEKVFQHLQEGVPAAVMAAISSSGPVRIKRA